MAWANRKLRSVYSRSRRFWATVKDGSSWSMVALMLEVMMQEIEVESTFVWSSLRACCDTLREVSREDLVFLE